MNNSSSNSFLHSHACFAALICCMDFRFWKATLNFVESELGIPDFDLITEAGGAKAILEEDEVALSLLGKQLEISANLHHSETIILVNHEDCGAYGGTAAFGGREKEVAAQKTNLRKSAEILKKKYPQAVIISLWAFFNSQGGISHEIVK